MCLLFAIVGLTYGNEVELDMYAGDFTWDKESQAFYMRHKLSNGQFCFIAKEDAIRARLEREAELFKEFAPQRALLGGIT